MKKPFFILLLTVILLVQSCLFPVYGETSEQESNDHKLKLNAQSAVLMDAVSGRILYGKNQELQRPMASTTKIMTCIVALEHGNLEDVVTASANAAAQPKVRMGVRKDQQFLLKDLLYSLMLESHNDAAVMIAEHIGGSVEGFARLMNQKARDLGCEDTWFITPNGLDATTTDPDGSSKIHSTTAADLSRIMKYCVLESPKKEDFLKVTRTQNYQFSDIKGRQSFHCTNHNAFLTMMSGVLSGKTGFTGGAGYSYIAALEDGNRVFVVALLGCGWPPHKTYKWSDARQLFNYGLDNYHYKEVFVEQKFDPVPVEEGIPVEEDIGEPAYVSLSLNLPEQEKSLKLLMDDQEKTRISVDVPKVLTAPVRQGQTVGTVTYYLEGAAVKTYPVFAGASVEKLSFTWCMEKMLDLYLSMLAF